MRDALQARHQEHGTTARGGLTWFDNRLAGALQNWLRQGDIRLELWDGSSPWADRGTGLGDVIVADRGALLRLLLNPDYEFGELYMAGRVRVRGALERVVEAAARLPGEDRPSWREWFALHFPVANDLLASRRNVHHHYDLGNDFYQKWLDEQLVYTCAYFPEAATSLEDAQAAKLDLVCRKLRLKPGERVIEAGCGWGALALHMAREYGARVTAFNISTEQLKFARERARREGLAGRVDFVEDDYRNVSGPCDAFVSVGMLEHVGRRHFRSLAAVLRRVLASDGSRGLLHFIGRDHPRPLNAWIRRRIFPGGYPPTLAEVALRVLEPAGQAIHDVQDLRFHYARTLTHWRERYEQEMPWVRERYGEAFSRAWHLYLAGSEAAFVTGSMQLFQVVFAPIASRRTYSERATMLEA
jgi:cyclopropane-fatty-acyl-phospholipid synthase